MALDGEDRSAKRSSQAWRRRVGEAVRGARRSRGLSLAKLGAAVGLDWTTIGRIERGERVPDLATIEAIADELALSLDETVGRVVAQTAKSPLTRQERRLLSYLVEGLTPAGPEATPPAVEGESESPPLTAEETQSVLKRLERLAERVAKLEGLSPRAGRAS